MRSGSKKNKLLFTSAVEQCQLDTPDSSGVFDGNLCQFIRHRLSLALTFDPWVNRVRTPEVHCLKNRCTQLSAPHLPRPQYGGVWMCMSVC